MSSTSSTWSLSAHDFPESDVPSCVQSHPLSYLLARAFWAFWPWIWIKVLSLKTHIILELLQTQSLEPSFGAHHCLGTSTLLSLFNQVAALSLAETAFAQDYKSMTYTTVIRFQSPSQQLHCACSDQCCLSYPAHDMFATLVHHLS